MPSCSEILRFHDPALEWEKNHAMALSLGHWVQTNTQNIERLQHIEGVGREDTVLDLGSGDGAFLLELAALTGCRGFGVEINPYLHVRAQEAKDCHKASELCHFLRSRIEDLTLDFVMGKKITHVYLYLFRLQRNPWLLSFLRTLSQLGVRIVSHQFVIPSGYLGRPARQWPAPGTGEELGALLSYSSPMHLFSYEPDCFGRREGIQKPVPQRWSRSRLQASSEARILDMRGSRSQAERSSKAYILNPPMAQLADIIGGTEVVQGHCGGSRSPAHAAPLDLGQGFEDQEDRSPDYRRHLPLPRGTWLANGVAVHLAVGEPAGVETSGGRRIVFVAGEEFEEEWSEYWKCPRYWDSEGGVLWTLPER